MSTQVENDDAPSLIPRGASAGMEPSKLYKLCYKKLPKHRKSTESSRGTIWRGLDIGKISEEIGVSKQKVSGWMKDNRIPAKRIQAMCNLEESEFVQEDLWPFVNMD